MMWNFIDSGAHCGADNMAIDLALAHCLPGDEAAPPVLRVYGWTPAAISIGRNQDEGDFDKEVLRRKGFDLVRRPTGGKAILHAHEVTYSVIRRLQGAGLREMYRQV